jgi:predicted transposase YdaD
MALRRLDYSVRLKRQYRCAVAQVVIFLQSTTNEAAFTEEYRDETTIHRYPCRQQPWIEFQINGSNRILQVALKY